MLHNEQTVFHSQLQSSGQKEKTRPSLYKERPEFQTFHDHQGLAEPSTFESITRTTKLGLDLL